ncbi:hypothetical protein K469DRAFT_700691 [Zopfia rhizophila CBS 207.26]|uniref:Uncharacterized protein n=1 Tax=Zopfia rhizophila CBS 207.26 TaxID=1314779 RepID=A0A6A6EG13_9PEZI|nr:hypothetical protein K469DRAFT_700691 [Zopfia rhizophila CBS 207.26]
MSAEPVSFTIFLHATTLIRDGVQNNWRSKESLLYYSLALRAVKEALKRRVEEYSDSFVTALAGFAACANFAGNYEAAEIHRDAMVKAVRLKGGGNLWEGIRKFNHFTQRALTWCEFHVAAKGPSLPKLPYTPPNTISALPPALLIEANRLNTLALSEVPTLSSPLPQILFQLNQLSLSHFHMALSLSSFVWIGHGKVPGSVVRLLYDTEYNLLKILSAQRESTHTFSALDIVYTEACQLYLWISIRRMPLEMKMYDLFVTRLKSALVSILDQTLGPKGTRTESDTLSSCDSEVAVKSTITFLWPLFLGTFVSSVGSRPECSWFLEQFTKIVQKTSQIRTKEDLQDMLKIFPWTDRICRRGIADIAFLFE